MIQCVLLNQGNYKDTIFPLWANSGSTLSANWRSVYPAHPCLWVTCMAPVTTGGQGSGRKETAQIKPKQNRIAERWESHV